LYPRPVLRSVSPSRHQLITGLVDSAEFRFREWRLVAAVRVHWPLQRLRRILLDPIRINAKREERPEPVDAKRCSRWRALPALAELTELLDIERFEIADLLRFAPGEEL